MARAYSRVSSGRIFMPSAIGMNSCCSNWAVSEDVPVSGAGPSGSPALTPHTAAQSVQDLAAMSLTWAAHTVAVQRAIALATQLNHHLFDTLYHALALEAPGAHFVTADRRYFDKAQHLGYIIWLPDLVSPTGQIILKT